MATNTSTSDTDNTSKDTDTFTSDTDNNNKDLNDNETRRQKQRKRKIGAPVKKADSRFVWEETHEDLELFEFSEENPGLTQDMLHNARPFDFLKLFLIEKLFFQTIANKTKEYAEKVIATSRPLRRRSTLNLLVAETVEETKKFIVVIYHMCCVSMPSYRYYWQKAVQYGDKFVKKTMQDGSFSNFLIFSILVIMMEPKKRD